MTREEAQALAEELVLRLVRRAFNEKRLPTLRAAREAYAGGLASMVTGDQIMSNAVVMHAAVGIELLRETFLQTGDTAEEIRAEHPTEKGP